MKIPAELKYSQDHEWVKVEGKIATIGITDFAQDQLGDVVYVELPAVGKELKAKAEFGVVESVKSVSSLYAPVSGKVVAVNADLKAKPQLVNESPYEQAWMVKVEMANPQELGLLLSADAYQKHLESH